MSLEQSWHVGCFLLEQMKFTKGRMMIINLLAQRIFLLTCEEHSLANPKFPSPRLDLDLSMKVCILTQPSAIK